MTNKPYRPIDAYPQAAAFLDGARFWEFEKTGGTMWSSEQERIANEAMKRYSEKVETDTDDDTTDMVKKLRLVADDLYNQASSMQIGRVKEKINELRLNLKESEEKRLAAEHERDIAQNSEKMWQLELNDVINKLKQKLNNVKAIVERHRIKKEALNFKSEDNYENGFNTGSQWVINDIEFELQRPVSEYVPSHLGQN